MNVRMGLTLRTGKRNVEAPANWIDLYRRLEAWFERWLKEGGAGDEGAGSG